VAIRTQEFTPQSMVVEMPLRSALTPAIRVSPWLERGLALVAVLACLIALLGKTRRSPGRTKAAQHRIAGRRAEEEGGDTLFVPERRQSRRPQSAIRAGDVRAADLQEEPTKRI
jgi:hypothetical protein